MNKSTQIPNSILIEKVWYQPSPPQIQKKKAIWENLCLRFYALLQIDTRSCQSQLAVSCFDWCFGLFFNSQLTNSIVNLFPAFTDLQLSDKSDRRKRWFFLSNLHSFYSETFYAVSFLFLKGIQTSQSSGQAISVSQRFCLAPFEFLLVSLESASLDKFHCGGLKIWICKLKIKKLSRLTFKFPSCRCLCLVGSFFFLFLLLLFTVVNFFLF